MAAWLQREELRIALGCMRLSTDPDPDETRALATIAAAVDAGITVFDTARAYGDNELLLARGLRAAGTGTTRVVTKGGMARHGGRWLADGRARALREDCERSLRELDGIPIDLYLVHAPDPRTPWRTTIRALAKLHEEGLVANIGVCNVTRAQLDEAAALAPLSAVQVGLSILDDTALRAGIVDRCAEMGLTLMAHSPLGGPRRSGRLSRHAALSAAAGSLGATEAEIALAWILSLGSDVVAVAGARRPETARSLARAALIQLDPATRRRLRPSRPRPGRSSRSGEVLVVMGIPGAGKSRLAHRYVADGYVRLNRDERGGTLRDIANALDLALQSGSDRIVLDNTYLTRAARSHVLDVAARHGAQASCIWIDTPLAQAQVNLVGRILERLGRLPAPDELAGLARAEPGLMAPASQMRAFRELEPPGTDEGFASVTRVEFERAAGSGRAGAFVAAQAASVLPDTVDRRVPHLVFDWRPAGTLADIHAARDAVAAVAEGVVESAVCIHEGGPPRCWCRPPLPGLVLAFAHRHGLDPARSVVVGASTAHRTLASALGARYVHGR